MLNQELNKLRVQHQKTLERVRCWKGVRFNISLRSVSKFAANEEHNPLTTFNVSFLTNWDLLLSFVGTLYLGFLNCLFRSYVYMFMYH